MTELPDKKKITELKKASADLDPLINVGKSGITENVINELKKQLKEKKLVKVRILKNTDESEDIKTTGIFLSQKTGSDLIDVRGRTVTLYKK